MAIDRVELKDVLDFLAPLPLNLAEWLWDKETVVDDTAFEDRRIVDGTIHDRTH